MGRELQLLTRLGTADAVELVDHVDGVHDRDHRVEAQDVGDARQGIDHGTGVGEAAGLHDDAVQVPRGAVQARDRVEQLALARAAHAAVGDLDDVVAGVTEQLTVQADLARLVDDDADALGAGPRRDETVDQRGLARAEKTGDHGDWNRALRSEIVGHGDVRSPFRL